MQDDNPTTDEIDEQIDELLQELINPFVEESVPDDDYWIGYGESIRSAVDIFQRRGRDAVVDELIEIVRETHDRDRERSDYNKGMIHGSMTVRKKIYQIELRNGGQSWD